MQIIHTFFVSMMLVVQLALSSFWPQTVAAAAATKPVSYGGRIALLIPCVSTLGPSIWVQIVPASPLLPPFQYIYTPATLLSIVPPVPAIPPSHPGQEVMGRFDIPFFCVIPVTPPIYLPGLRMQTLGVSPA